MNPLGTKCLIPDGGVFKESMCVLYPTDLFCDGLSQRRNQTRHFDENKPQRLPLLGTDTNPRFVCKSKRQEIKS